MVRHIEPIINIVRGLFKHCPKLLNIDRQNDNATATTITDNISHYQAVPDHHSGYLFCFQNSLFIHLIFQKQTEQCPGSATNIAYVLFTKGDNILLT